MIINSFFMSASPHSLGNFNGRKGEGEDFPRKFYFPS